MSFSNPGAVKRIWHFLVAAVSQYDAAYRRRLERGVPLGFSPRLWRHGWEAEIADAIEHSDRCAALGTPMGLFVMRPFGSPTGAGTSYRIDASARFQEQTHRNPVTWLGALRLVEVA